MTIQILGGGANNMVTLHHGKIFKDYMGHIHTPLTPSERKHRERSALIRFGGGLAPEFLGMNQSLLIQSYIKGISIQNYIDRKVFTNEMAYDAGKTLQQIHQKLPHPRIHVRMNFIKTIKHIWDRVFPILVWHDINPEDVKNAMKFDWRVVTKQGTVFTHGDYCFRNIIKSETGFRVIDWENAGEASAYEDLAQMITWGFRFNRLHSLDGFYEGYGMLPNEGALRAFTIKRLLVYLNSMGLHYFNKGWHNNEPFNFHVLATIKNNI